jgi:hypothetical protein
MSAENNLSDPQFKKTKWVPDQEAPDVWWHVLGSHQTGGVMKHQAESEHARHHAEGRFLPGKEHTHFTPKKKK